MKKILFSFLLILLTSCSNKVTENTINDNIHTIKNNWEYSEKMTKEEINKELSIKEGKIKEFNKDMLVYGVWLYNDWSKNTWFNWDINICDNWSDLYICKLILKGFFDYELRNSCIWVKDISNCDKLKWDEVKYCKSDFYLMDLISTRDIKVCNNFNNDFELWYLMSSEKFNNKEFCIKLYNDLISKDNINENDINNFVADIEVIEENTKSVTSILESLLLDNNKSLNFKDYLKTEYRKKELKCGELRNPQYLLRKLKGIKYIFDTEIEALESYEFLWADR